MSASTILDAERSAGATIRSRGGIDLPEDFGDAGREYAAARSAAGLFDLSFRARLRFHGEDRTTFLHNLLSADVQAVAPGSGVYTTLLTQQSKIVCDANLF